MSRDLDFDGWWQGDAVYTCDCPGCTKSESFRFESEDENDAKEHRRILRQDKGWNTTKINGKWYDFCCETCRNKAIRLKTK